MRVAICLTKHTSQVAQLLDAFAKGVRSAGDTAILCGSLADWQGQQHRIDVAVQASTENRRCTDRGVGLFRWELSAARQPRLVLDTGFLQPATAKLHAVGLGDLKRHARYFADSCPSDRWGQLGLEIKPYRDGGHVLLLGQHPKGQTVQYIDLYQWYRSALESVRQITDRPILYRLHPRCGGANNPHGARHLQRMQPLVREFGLELRHDTSLADDLTDAGLVVAHASNAACRAVVEGVPVITTSQLSMAWPMAGHAFGRPHIPTDAERWQWCCDLAYCQWTDAEIRRGLPWRHFRPHLEAGL